jgi:low temperature requirement protein LtrA
METSSGNRAPRLSTPRRQDERVTPLELFFDLVFVLAITQCTALMYHHPTWEGLGQGLLVLGLLWWSWGAYAWLTSVLDPEDDAVRISMFAAMAGLLIASICIPQAYGDLAVEFAVAYGVVRAAHIALFGLASRDDPSLRRSVGTIAISTAIGVGLLLAGALAGGTGQAVLWVIALALDLGIPFFFGAAGWKLVPHHFAERHGLIIIIALGESVVAIGAGAHGLDLGMATAAVLGVALAAAMWWTYFDVVAIVAARRLAEAEPGREQNEMARDSYSYMHFLMVAGIVLAALGLKTTIGDVDEPLGTVPTFALLGGLAIYLLGHVAFRFRHVHTINRQRLGLAVLLVAAVPLADGVAPLVILAIVDVLLAGMIAYETRIYGEGRQRLRHEVAPAPAGD